jgi:hypothetical protein
MERSQDEERGKKMITLRVVREEYNFCSDGCPVCGEKKEVVRYYDIASDSFIFRCIKCVPRKKSFFARKSGFDDFPSLERGIDFEFNFPEPIKWWFDDCYIFSDNDGVHFEEIETKD